MRARLATALFLVVVAAGCSDEAAGDSRCGDGVREGREECDVGLLNSDTTPNSCRRDCTYPICGDGVVDNAPVFNEACDPPDGVLCDEACQLILPNCGDGVRGSGEECDDGDNNSNTTPNACRMNCQLPSCGDGVIDDDPSFGEACDPPDGVSCDDSCQRLVPPNCGDGVLDPNEECDDNNLTPGDGCSDACAEESGWSCAGEPSSCITTCGDGTVAGVEACDDGNTDPADGCDSSCAIEPGWACAGSPSTCDPVCGDSLLLGGEQCDDGNVDAGDGCDSTCVVEAGWACTGSPTSTCNTICGDGVVAGQETCDDGNSNSGDGCATTCTVEPGWACTASPSLCDPVCGDGILVAGEACDDGNAAAGDGCSPGCTVETNWSCAGEPSLCSCANWYRGPNCDVCSVLVDVDPTIVQRDGLTWATAFATVQGGIDLAESIPGSCEVWVAEGTYYVFDTIATDTVQLRVGVDVYGGFAGIEDDLSQRNWQTNVTILSGWDPLLTQQVFHVVTGANTATLDGFTITGGFANTTGMNANGAGILNVGVSPTIRNCIIEDNVALNQGGGIYSAGSATISNCSFVLNSATEGGGIYIDGNTTVSNSVFDLNSAVGWGGGAYLWVGGNISGSIFSNNTAAEGGGAYAFSSSSSIVFSGNTFQNNTADYGGGINALGDGIQIDGCTFLTNDASVWGGGLHVGSEAVVSNCLFDGNTAAAGGGLAVNGGPAARPDVIDSTFIGNSASTGGGMLASWNTSPKLTRVEFTANSAANGGGLYLEWFARVDPFERCVFDGNSATNSGGAIYYEDTFALSPVANSIFAGNGATNGGAVYVSGGNPAFTQCTLVGNTADTGGAFYVADASSPSFVNLIIWGNFALTDPSVFVAGGVGPSITYTNIEDGFLGNGNIDLDPQFVDPLGGDYHLLATSPCVDTGDDGNNTPTDYDGNARIDIAGVGIPGTATDMGAFEYIP